MLHINTYKHFSQELFQNVCLKNTSICQSCHTRVNLPEQCRLPQQKMAETLPRLALAAIYGQQHLRMFDT